MGHAGVSNHSLAQWQAAERAFGGAVLSNQVRFNLVDRGPDRDLVPWAQREGRVVIAYSPLAQGCFPASTSKLPLETSGASEATSAPVRALARNRSLKRLARSARRKARRTRRLRSRGSSASPTSSRFRARPVSVSWKKTWRRRMWCSATRRMQGSGLAKVAFG